MDIPAIEVAFGVSFWWIAVGCVSTSDPSASLLLHSTISEAQRLTVVSFKNNKGFRMDPLHPVLQPLLVDSKALPRAISMEDLPYPRGPVDATWIFPPGCHCLA